MKRNVRVSDTDATRDTGRAGGRMPILGCVVLLAAAGFLAGCADDDVMRNPRTGLTETCRQSLHGLDPSSQTMACVASHEAQGWTRSGPE
jgi:hypothetical protein